MKIEKFKAFIAAANCRLEVQQVPLAVSNRLSNSAEIALTLTMIGDGKE